jgi:protease-4
MLRPVRNYLAFLVLTAVVTLVTFAVGLWWFGRWYDEWSGFSASRRVGDGRCNVAVIPVEGEIGFFGHREGKDSRVADADAIVATIQQAHREPQLRAILVRIDSLGGGPVASRVVADTLKRSTLPVAAVIRESATSGGYIVASGANRLFADPMSDVGAIGVTESYVENVEKNRLEGLNFVPLSSGKYKDVGDPNKPLTAEERALMERDLALVHAELVKIVASNRKLPLNDVQALADGSSMTGALAEQKGLVDALGDEDSARAWFAQKLRTEVENIHYCAAKTIEPSAAKKRSGPSGE